MAAAVMVTYGVSFFINTVTTRVLAAPHWSTSIMLNSGGRAVTLAVIVGVMWRRGGKPPGPLVLSRAAAMPAAVALIGNLGFIAYFQLLEGGEVSVLTPMIGLYSVLAVVYALVVRGEERTRAKLAGIVLSAAAVVVLGFSGASFDGGSGGASGAAVAWKVAMFVLAFVLWGTNDIISSGVTVDPFTTALACMASHTACAAAAGMVAYAASTTTAAAVLADVAAAAAAGVPPNTTLAALLAHRPDAAALQPWGWGHVLLLAANAMAISGWLAFVRLGKIGQASSFIPVVSLYTFIPVALSIIFLGERLNAVKAVGLVIAAAAVVVLGRSWTPKAAPAATATAQSQTQTPART